MKTLYLLRHAKSSWKYRDLTDFERPLNKRGRRDAPLMGQLMKKKGILPEVILSSPATRAINTARLFAKEAGFESADIIAKKEIYGASPDDLIEMIRSTDDTHNSAMVVGHNPTLTYTAEMLSKYDIDNIPTSAIFCVQFIVDSWQKVEAGNGIFVFFEYPKKYVRG